MDKLKTTKITEELEKPFFQAIEQYGLTLSGIAVVTNRFLNWKAAFVAIVAASICVRLFRKYRAQTFRYENILWLGSVILFLPYLIISGIKIHWEVDIFRRFGVYHRLEERFKDN